MVDEALDVEFGFLDALGDFDFLLAGEERNLPHLFEIHPNRIVQNIELGVALIFFLLLFVVFFAVLVAVDLGGVDDVDLHAAQTVEDRLHLVGLVDAIREGFVEVVESEVALFLGELDEFAQFFGHFRRIDIKGDGLRGFDLGGSYGGNFGGSGGFAALFRLGGRGFNRSLGLRSGSGGCFGLRSGSSGSLGLRSGRGRSLGLRSRRGGWLNFFNRLGCRRSFFGHHRLCRWFGSALGHGLCGDLGCRSWFNDRLSLLHRSLNGRSFGCKRFDTRFFAGNRSRFFSWFSGWDGSAFRSGSGSFLDRFGHTQAISKPLCFAPKARFHGRSDKGRVICRLVWKRSRSCLQQFMIFITADEK